MLNSPIMPHARRKPAAKLAREISSRSSASRSTSFNSLRRSSLGLSYVSSWWSSLSSCRSSGNSGSLKNCWCSPLMYSYIKSPPVSDTQYRNCEVIAMCRGKCYQKVINSVSISKLIEVTVTHSFRNSCQKFFKALSYAGSDSAPERTAPNAVASRTQSG